MKQLEDKVKDRLENYESRLPEGDLAEFKALLVASSTSGAKRSVWLAPAAVAAGLALFFALGHKQQQDVYQVTDSSSLVADVAPILPADAIDFAEPQPAEDAAAVLTSPMIPRRTNRPDATVAVSEKPENENSASDISEQNPSGQNGNDPQTGWAEQNGVEKRKDDNSSVSSAGYSPFMSSSNSRKPVSVKVGRATAGVLGGTSALALASVLPSILMRYDSGCIFYDADDPGSIYTDPEPLTDRRTMSDTHYIPLRADLSVRIPFNERWSLTTGLAYSWYTSEVEYSLSGIHKQNAQYLGIPLRADYTIARNRWMDVYVSAGGSVDFCVAAFDAGKKVDKDGAEFSLIGGGGMQFNINKYLGLFLDPVFSWNIPSSNRVLDTYKTENPFMFTVSTGLRITLPSRKATAGQLAMGSF